MDQKNEKRNLVGVVMAVLLMNAASAQESKPLNMASGQLRLGYITAKDDAGLTTDTLALGGKLGLITPTRHGLGAGVTFYSTNALFGKDENSFFLDTKNDGYSIVGEAWLSFGLGNTLIKAGRQEIDTPFADTNDIGMIPNTFAGVVVNNNDIPGTSLVGMHLRKWAGVDTDVPEEFSDINSDKGVNAVGAIYEGIDSVSLQGWFYQGRDFANLAYLEAAWEVVDALNLALQYTTQSNKTDDNSGPDGEAWGVAADYTIADFTLSAAYNDVSDTVINGFGGGPYFTSTEDLTIDGVADEQAVMLGLEYTGFGPLTLAALRTDFDKGEDETDLIVSVAIQENFVLDIVYSDMSDAGEAAKVFVNYDF